MEIKMLPCPLCCKPQFDCVDSLRTTLVSVATSPLKCPVCEETLMGLDKLTIHLFSHINSAPSKHDEQYDVFQESSTPIEEQPRLQNPSEQPTNDRVETNQPITEQNDRLICDICSFSFTDKNILEMHQNLLHQTTPDKTTGLYSYHCHLCSKKFRMKGSLMVHLRVAHYGFLNHSERFENKAEKYDEGGLKEEEGKGAKGQGKGQDNNKQWGCDVCQKMFTTKYFLKKHKRLHTGEMPYCCNLCNKSFTFQQSYHKHMLYHSSEKPYVCNECGRAFKELSTLQNHARIHSGERPFGCETCGKRFRQRVSYLVHRRIHTGVMPYKCTACDKSFRYKVSQKSHKCPVNPPGSVVKIPESQEGSGTPPVANTNKKSGTKCIMSVDYNTGNINFIQENRGNYFEKGNVQKDANFERKRNIDEKNKEPTTINQLELREAIGNSNGLILCSPGTMNEIRQDQRDYFSMALSPILPEVESLCLNSNSPVDSHPISPEENIQIMSEQCLEELFGTNH